MLKRKEEVCRYKHIIQRGGKEGEYLPSRHVWKRLEKRFELETEKKWTLGITSQTKLLDIRKGSSTLFTSYESSISFNDLTSSLLNSKLSYFSVVLSTLEYPPRNFVFPLGKSTFSPKV